VVSGVADRISNVLAHWYFSMPSYLRTERALCISCRYQGISSLMAGKAGHSVPKYLASIPLILLGVNGQCTVQPVACFQQPVQLTGGITRIRHVSYVVLADT
jgi:hypothetical protein